MLLLHQVVSLFSPFFFLFNVRPMRLDKTLSFITPGTSSSKYPLFCHFLGPHPPAFIPRLWKQCPSQSAWLHSLPLPTHLALCCILITFKTLFSHVIPLLNILQQINKLQCATTVYHFSPTFFLMHDSYNTFSLKHLHIWKIQEDFGGLYFLEFEHG